MTQPPHDPPPYHRPSPLCPLGRCIKCSPHTALRDLVGDNRTWIRSRLFSVLVGAGITSPEAIAAMSDDELLAIEEIGDGRLDYLRYRLAGGADPSPLRPTTPAERLAAGIEAELRRHGGGGALP